MFQPKPNPGAIKYILNKYCINKKNILYIGDTDSDFSLAKYAGCKFIAACWYQNNITLLTKHKCHNLNDLISCIQRILK